MDDSDGKLDALVLFSFFTVTGIDRTDLQDGETQQKLSTAIAEAIGVSSESVKIDTITTTTINLSVSIKYHVVVYTEDEKYRDDAHVAQVQTKMETLDKNSGVKSIIAKQVGIDAQAIGITPGKVTSSNVDSDQDDNTTVQDHDNTTVQDHVSGEEDGMNSATLSNAWWISLVVISVVLFVILVAVLLVKQNRCSLQGNGNKKSNVPAVAMTEMTKINSSTKKQAGKGKSGRGGGRGGRGGGGGGGGGGSRILTMWEVQNNPCQAIKPSPIPKRRRTEEKVAAEDAVFDRAAAAPPENQRTPRSRRREKRHLPTPLTPSTPAASSFSEESLSENEQATVMTQMGPGKLLYQRPNDDCCVFELSWKLAGSSKAILYSFKK